MTDFYPTLRKDLNRELTWDELDGNFEKIKTGLDKSVKIAGYFSAGFVYKSYNEIGVTPDGQWWSYNGSLPFTVPAGTVPSEPNYTNHGDAALRSELGNTGGAELVKTSDGRTVEERLVDDASLVNELSEFITNEAGLGINRRGKLTISTLPPTGVPADLEEWVMIGATDFGALIQGSKPEEQ